MAIVLWLFLLFKSQICEDTIQYFFNEINEIETKYNSMGAEIAWQASLDPGKTGLVDMAADYQMKRIFWQEKVCKKLAHVHERHPRNLNSTQARQAYLLCRGPNSTLMEVREISNMYEELQYIYSDIEICIPNASTSDNLTTIENAVIKFITDIEKYIMIENKPFIVGIIKSGLCFKGERAFQKIMEYSRNPNVLKWFWLVWRENTKLMKRTYDKLVQLENNGARRAGYSDIGESWREDLEIPNLRELSLHLYESIKPLYTLLHGVTRFYLRQQYGDIVPETGPIPAHLLGDLWSQNWEPLADLLLPRTINLDHRMRHLNWTVIDMVKKAEDFYVSLGLPPMTNAFWKQSVFTRGNRTNARCHGSAADMFKSGDFRLLYCSERTFKDFTVIHHEMGHIQYYMAYPKSEKIVSFIMSNIRVNLKKLLYCSERTFKDFTVIHHEMGHIQYYMAYQNQPGIFRQANSFLHEAIGDTIMQAVMTPQHLHRLRLINDSELFNTNSNKEINFIEKIIKNGSGYLSFDLFGTKTESKEINERSSNFEDPDRITIDEILIFKQALNKLPQIPFAYIIDEYRWRYFEGSLGKNQLNQEFWAMATKFQGISPPNERGEEYFDIGAKFHVPDNTPYIRYFLSSFLQHQIFENLCKAAVFGHRNMKDPLPFTIHLNRCDIYGSKPAGKILKDLMSRGHSQHWQKILQETIGDNKISASALKRYYRPLYKILMKLVDKYKIPIGW